MSDTPQFVTLGVAEDLLAAPVGKVQEILDLRPIARLPQAPVNLLGMIDVRGLNVPVLDLRLTLGRDPAPDTADTRILVLSVVGRHGPMTVGLKADQVFEVTGLDDARLDPPPAIGGDWNGGCVAGIGRRHGRFVTVLDLDQLVGSAVADLDALAEPAS